MNTINQNMYSVPGLWYRHGKTKLTLMQHLPTLMYTGRKNFRSISPGSTKSDHYHLFKGWIYCRAVVLCSLRFSSVYPINCRFVMLSYNSSFNNKYTLFLLDVVPIYPFYGFVVSSSVLEMLGVKITENVFLTLGWTFSAQHEGKWTAEQVVVHRNGITLVQILPLKRNYTIYPSQGRNLIFFLCAKYFFQSCEFGKPCLCSCTFSCSAVNLMGLP